MVKHEQLTTYGTSLTIDTLKLRSFSADLKRIMPFLHPLLADQSVERITNIQTAVHEVCLHIIENVYGELAFGIIEVSALRYSQGIEIIIRDDAPEPPATLDENGTPHKRETPFFHILPQVFKDVTHHPLEDGHIWTLRRTL